MTTNDSERYPVLVAVQFCNVLTEWLKPAELDEVRKRNEGYMNKGDMGVCASHDFCDANEAMDEAYRRVRGHTASSTGGEDVGAMSDEAQAIWERAWTIAKTAGFRPDGIITPRCGLVIDGKQMWNYKQVVYVRGKRNSGDFSNWYPDDVAAVRDSKAAMEEQGYTVERVEVVGDEVRVYVA